MAKESEKEGPFVIVRVAGARLALPIAVVARMEAQESVAPFDLGQLTGLCQQPAARASAIALKTAAGIVNVAIDDLEDLVTEARVQPLPPLTRLTQRHAVRGLIAHESRNGSAIAVLVDGDTLGDRIAERVLASGS